MERPLFKFRAVYGEDPWNKGEQMLYEVVFENNAFDDLEIYDLNVIMPNIISIEETGEDRVTITAYGVLVEESE